jgi:hypothetical protein
MLIDQWDQLWKSGLWAAPMSRALEDLTPRQAAWRPDLPPGRQDKRHSIWQIVNHIMFWREVALRRSMGGPGPTEEEAASRNFDAPTTDADATESNWQATREHFGDSHQQIAAALADPGIPIDRLQYLIGHDCYHLGQIMLLRAMLGLPHIE